MKLGQNVCLDKILDGFENGSCQVKNFDTSSNLKKTCVRSRGQTFSPVLMNLVRMFASITSRISYKMGHDRSKTRSPVQILEKPCVRSRGHISLQYS